MFLLFALSLFHSSAPDSIHAAGSAKELISRSSRSIPKPETGTFRRARAVAAVRRRARDAAECHREDWSSVLRDKNLFSIMSEDTFLVRAIGAHSDLVSCARRNSFIGHYFGTLLLAASQSSGAISLSFRVAFAIPPRTLSAASTPSTAPRNDSGEP